MRLIRMLLLPALALTAVSAHADPASVASLTNLRSLKLAENPIEDFSPLAKIYSNLEDKDFELK